jgi:hypothetical protein
VYGDRIGVLFIPGSTPAQWKEALNRFGYPMIEQHGPRLASFALGSDTDLREIVRLGTELKRNDQIVALAGFVQLIDEQSGEVRVVPNQILVEFPPNAPSATITAAISGIGATTLKESRFVPNQFLIALPDSTTLDPFRACEALVDGGARIAEPNYVLNMQDRETIPTDPLFAQQWHHKNTGTVPDADIDTPLAWDLVAGVTDWPLVAVIEGGGFEVTHPDYAANVVPEMWDFRDCDAAPTPDCGDNVLDVAAHGTAVAGAIAAEADGARGVVGVCPHCKLLLLEAGGAMDGEIMAFDYAREQGAAVISNSRGYRAVPGLMREAIERATNRGRDGLGSVVTFAMSSTPVWRENCAGPEPDVSALPDVIGVSASSEFDTRSFAGYGNCLDVLAPADPAGTGGTHWAVTTDVTGPMGYNPPRAGGACSEISDVDYTSCFGGTSFATPLVSATAALVIAANPNLTAAQVQRVLQDTADKIEPGAATYNTVTGFSEPTTPPREGLPVGSTHGYGRINAYEAVKLVAASSAGGNEGYDVFMRDNRLDWGNTEQPSNVLFEAPRDFIPHYESVDIKVDAPDYEAAAPTPETFDAFPDEPALGGELNHVYVRVRNRGPRLAENVQVQLYWADASAGLPPVSADFWPEFPRNVEGPDWHYVIAEGVRAEVDVAYSGESATSDREYWAQIVRFDFQAPVIDSSDPNARHHCLMAIAFSDQDPISAAARSTRVVDDFTPRDNNITQKNVQVLRDRSEQGLDADLMMHNATGSEMETRLRALSPNGWTVTFEPASVTTPFVLEAGRSVAVVVHIVRPAGAKGEVRVIQERSGSAPLYQRVVGGNTYRFE